MKGVNFVRVRDNGDATTTYNISVTSPMMLTEFCDRVIQENPKEWGSVYVNNEKVMEYSHGRGTAMGAFYRYCCKPLTSGWADGGCGSMDYHMKVEE